MALPLSCRERRGKTLESIRSCRLLLVGLTTLVRNTRKRCSRQDGKDAKNVFVSLRGVAAALGQVMNPGSDLTSGLSRQKQLRPPTDPCPSPIDPSSPDIREPRA